MPGQGDAMQAMVQFVIDNKKALKQAKQGVEDIQSVMSSGVSMPMTILPNITQALKALSDLKTQQSQLQSSIKKTTQEYDRLGKEVNSVGKTLDKNSVNFTNRLKEAFKRGGAPEAKRIIEEAAGIAGLAPGSGQRGSQSRARQERDLRRRLEKELSGQLDFLREIAAYRKKYGYDSAEAKRLFKEAETAGKRERRASRNRAQISQEEQLLAGDLGPGEAKAQKAVTRLEERYGKELVTALRKRNRLRNKRDKIRAEFNESDKGLTKLNARLGLAEDKLTVASKKTSRSKGSVTRYDNMLSRETDPFKRADIENRLEGAKERHREAADEEARIKKQVAGLTKEVNQRIKAVKARIGESKKLQAIEAELRQVEGSLAATLQDTSTRAAAADEELAAAREGRRSATRGVTEFQRDSARGQRLLARRTLLPHEQRTRSKRLRALSRQFHQQAVSNADPKLNRMYEELARRASRKSEAALTPRDAFGGMRADIAAQISESRESVKTYQALVAGGKLNPRGVVKYNRLIGMHRARMGRLQGNLSLIDYVSSVGTQRAHEIAEGASAARPRLEGQLAESRAAAPRYAAMSEIMRVHGIGAQKAGQIYDTLGVTSLDELRAAAQSGALRTVPGLGPKIEGNVLKSLTTDASGRSLGRQPTVGRQSILYSRLSGIHEARARRLTGELGDIGKQEFLASPEAPEAVLRRLRLEGHGWAALTGEAMLSPDELRRNANQYLQSDLIRSHLEDTLKKLTTRPDQTARQMELARTQLRNMGMSDAMVEQALTHMRGASPGNLSPSGIGTFMAPLYQRLGLTGGGGTAVIGGTPATGAAATAGALAAGLRLDSAEMQKSLNKVKNLKVPVGVDPKALYKSLNRAFRQFNKSTVFELSIPVKLSANAIKAAIAKTKPQLAGIFGKKPIEPKVKIRLGLDDKFFLKEVERLVNVANSQGFKIQVGAVQKERKATKKREKVAAGGAGSTRGIGTIQRNAGLRATRGEAVIDSESALRGRGYKDLANRLAKITAGHLSQDPKVLQGLRDQAQKFRERAAKQLRAKNIKPERVRELESVLAAIESKILKPLERRTEKMARQETRAEDEARNKILRREEAARIARDPRYVKARQEQILANMEMFQDLNRRQSFEAQYAWLRGPAGAMASTLTNFMGARPDFGMARPDMYAEREHAQRRVFAAHRQYRDVANELLNTEQTSELMGRGAKRLAKAMRSIEQAESQFQMSHLMNKEIGGVPVLKPYFKINEDGSGFSILPRHARGRGGALVRQTMAAPVAYDQSNRMLTHALGGQWMDINESIVRKRMELLQSGRASDFARGSKMRGLRFDEVLQHVFEGKTPKGLGKYETSLLKSLKIEQKMKTELSHEYEIRKKLTAEVQKETRLMNAYRAHQTLQDQRQRRLSPYRHAARAASYQLGLYGIGFMAAYQVRASIAQYAQFEQELADIQGVLSSKSPIDRSNLRSAVVQSASKYGAGLVETAQAAKILAQAGLNVTEVIDELDATMLAMRGLGMTVEQMEELQIAVKAVTGEIGHSMEILEKVARVEARFAITSQDIADALKVFSPVADQFANGIVGIGDAFDYTIGMSTVMVEKLRITGKQAGAALKFIFARLLRPEVAKVLEGTYGLGLYKEGGKELLPLPDILTQIERRYQELELSGEHAKAQRMLAQISGGRRVNQALALFNSYDRVLEVVQQSSFAFGDAQERAALSMDTLQSRTAQLRTTFQAWSGDLLESTGLAEGFKLAIQGLSGAMGALSGSKAGLGLLMLTAGGAGIVQGSKRFIHRGNLARDARTISRISGISVTGADLRSMEMRRQAEAISSQMGAGPSIIGYMGSGGQLLRKEEKAAARAVSKLGIVRKGLGKVFGTLAGFLGPGGVLLVGSLALIGIMGGISKFIEWARSRGIDPMRLTDFTADSTGARGSPQYKRYAEFANNRFGIEDPNLLYLQTRQLLGTALVHERTGGANVSGIAKVIRDYRGFKMGGVPENFNNMTPEQQEKALEEFRRRRDKIEQFRTRITEAWYTDAKAMGLFEDALDSAVTKEEKMLLVTQMIGHAAWAANALIQKSLQELTDDLQTYTDMVAKNAEVLSQNVGKALPSRTKSGATVLSPYLLEKRVRSAATQLFHSEELGMQGDQLGKSLAEALGPELQTILSDTNTQETGVTQLNRALTEAAKDPKRWDEIVNSLVNTYLVRVGAKGRTVASATDASDPTAANTFLQNSRMLLESVRTRAAAMGRQELYSNSPLANLLKQFDLFDRIGAKGVFSNLNAVSDALIKLKNVFLDTVLDFYMAQEKIRAESGFAARTGSAYNPVQSTMTAAKNLAIGVATLDSQYNRTLTELVEKRERIYALVAQTDPDLAADLKKNGSTMTDLQKLRKGYAATQGGVIRPDVQRAFEYQEQVIELEGKISAYKTQREELLENAHNLVDLIKQHPGVSAPTNVVNALEKSLMSYGQNPSDTLASQVQANAEALFRAMKSIVDELRDTKTGIDLSLKRAQALADVAEKSKDFMQTLSGRRAAEEKIQRDLLQSRLDAVDAEMQADIAAGMKVNEAEFEDKKTKIRQEYEIEKQKRGELNKLEDRGIRRDFRMQRLDQTVDFYRRMRDLSKASIRPEQSLTEQTIRREQAQRLFVQRQLEAIQNNEELLEWQKNLQSEQLRYEYQATTFEERQNQLVEARNELLSQTYSNVRSMLSGVESSLKDLNIWQAIFESEDQGAAVKQAIANILKPITDALYGRVVDNFVANLGAEIMSVQALKNFVQLPESRMKDKLSQASDLAGSGMPGAALSAGRAMESAIVRGGVAVGRYWATILGQSALPGSGSVAFYAPGGKTGPPGPGEPNPFFTTDINKMPSNVRKALQSKFIQNTIYPAIGGRPRYLAYMAHDLIPNLAPYAIASKTLKGVSFFGNQTFDASPYQLEQVYMHELGHILDFRNLAPNLEKRVKSYYPAFKKANPGAYGSNNEEEFFGEAFMQASDLLRNFQRSPRTMRLLKEGKFDQARREVMGRLNTSMPGTREIFEWLLTQPQMAGSPLQAFRGTDVFSTLTADMQAGAYSPYAPGSPLSHTIRIGPKRPTFGFVGPVGPSIAAAKGAAHQQRMAAIKSQLGMIGGTMGGTLASQLVNGKSGQYSQMGASLGAMLGSMTPLGPIGSVLGGIAGGLIGGLFDDDKKKAGPIHQLEAIERAQRDTISVIERSTEDLMSPESRFLNLPSTFNVPAYAPNFGGGGAVSIGKIDITVHGGDPGQVQREVEAAMGNILYDGIQNRGRSHGRLS